MSSKKSDIEDPDMSNENVEYGATSDTHQKLLDVITLKSLTSRFLSSRPIIVDGVLVRPASKSLLNECIAEAIGTMFIVIFGVGAVCSAVLLKKGVDILNVTIIFGFGISLAIYVTSTVSPGHLNPAVTLSQALFRPKDFPISKLIPYWIAQYIGGILGGAFNLMIFGPAYNHFEEINNIKRGSENSLITASTFGEYFPAPGGGIFPEGKVISIGFAFLVEAWATGILVFVIMAFTHKKFKAFAGIPFYIGFTVAILQTLYIPFTQGGLNPARDFGPRLVAAMAGWGSIAIPGPRNGFWIYIIGPKVGALVGSWVFATLLEPGFED